MTELNLITLDQKLRDAKEPRVKPLYPDLDIQNKIYRISPAALNFFKIVSEAALLAPFAGGLAASNLRESVSYTVISDEDLKAGKGNRDVFILETVTVIKGHTMTPMMQATIDANRRIFNAYTE